MRRARLLAAPVWTLALLCALAAFADPIPVPGTRASLDPPPGFELAAEFSGFFRQDPPATIATAELASSFVDAHALYTDASLLQQGVRVRSRDAFERDGLRSELIEAEQTVNGQALIKLIYITGDVQDSLAVTATILAKDAPALREPLRSALSSTFWEPSRPLDLFDGLGFRLEDVPELRLASRAAGSIVFTGSGAPPDMFYTGQLMVGGWSRGDVTQVTDHEAFAQDQFRRMGLLQSGKVDNMERTRFDGHDAIEITGHGVHRNLGFDVDAFQVIVLYPARFFMAQGIVADEDRVDAYNRFRSVLSTLVADKDMINERTTFRDTLLP